MLFLVIYESNSMHWVNTSTQKVVDEKSHGSIKLTNMLNMWFVVYDNIVLNICHETESYIPFNKLICTVLSSILCCKIETWIH